MTSIRCDYGYFMAVIEKSKKNQQEVIAVRHLNTLGISRLLSIIVRYCYLCDYGAKLRVGHADDGQHPNVDDRK